MKKKLIILNYQKSIPTFINNIINEAVDDFEKVVLITRRLKVNDKVHKDATLYQESRLFWFFALLTTFFLLFSRKSVTSIIKAIKHKTFSFKFLKRHLVALGASQLLYFRAKKYIKKYGQENVSVLAIWFYAESLAAARLKKKFPAIKAISLSHAFEIDEERNTNALFLLNEFRHLYLDKILFISSRKMETYKKRVATIYKSINLENCSLLYLGTFKSIPGRTTILNDGVLRLVSCSSVIKLKRLDLILDSLSKVSSFKVEWHHFGGGYDFENIKSRAESINNDLVSITLFGNTSNQEILTRYGSYNYNLFINVSTTEGVPVSIMEACSYGIPTLATDVGGTREIVSNETGYLVDKDVTPEELEAIYEKHLKLSLNELNRISDLCIEKWEKKFNGAVNYKQLINLLKEEKTS